MRPLLTVILRLTIRCKQCTQDVGRERERLDGELPLLHFAQHVLCDPVGRLLGVAAGRRTRSK